MRDNWKLRTISDRLSNNSHIGIVNERPLVFEWKSRDEQTAVTVTEQTMVEASKQPSEVCEQCDAVGDVLQNEQYKHDEKSLNEKDVQAIPTPSHTSHTSHSDSVYADLIMEEHFPNFSQTVYRCKEHPEIPYYDLAGIEESHFKPDHNYNNDNSGNVQ